MRVLYVNHTASISGAEQSLLLLLRSAPASLSPYVACPEGPLAEAVRAIGVPVHSIQGTDLSARLHPVHTIGEAAKAARAAWSIRSIAQRVGADVIDANTPRAALMTLAARGANGAKPVVHLHDSVPPGVLPKLMSRLLAAGSSVLVPTTRFLADQLPPSWTWIVVGNGIEPDRFDPRAFDRSAARSRLGLDGEAPVMAVVGQISPHKGQSDAIRTLKLVRDVHPDAQLLIVGSVKFASAATRFDNQAYRQELAALADRLAVHEATHFLGEREDIAEILAAVDLLLVPSWYEPFGLVALEAMSMEVPVVATSIGGAKEVVTDGVDGLVLGPRSPSDWAHAANTLLADPAKRSRMGAAGRLRALNTFSADRQISQMLKVYEHVLGSSPLDYFDQGWSDGPKAHPSKDAGDRPPAVAVGDQPETGYPLRWPEGPRTP